MNEKKQSVFWRRFPLRLWWMVALVVGFNCLVYYGTRFINHGRVHHCIVLPLDAHIPFVPAFILIYVLAYVQWAYGYYLAAHKETRARNYFLCAMLLAKALCGICFLLYPTCMLQRPTPAGTDLFQRLTAFIFASDTPPDNLFPSIHCLESWMCLRIICHEKALPKWLKWSNGVFTLLVFASVVLVKQHVAADIPAGVAAAEMGLLLSRWIFKHKEA